MPTTFLNVDFLINHVSIKDPCWLANLGITVFARVVNRLLFLMMCQPVQVTGGDGGDSVTFIECLLCSSVSMMS